MVNTGFTLRNGKPDEMGQFGLVEFTLTLV